ncbi:alpha/beta hydrolase family protein, partial [Staphylococcus aureus]
ETFYQMAEGHVPRPPAMVETLTYIKEFMNQVESHS